MEPSLENPQNTLSKKQTLSLNPTAIVLIFTARMALYQAKQNFFLYHQSSHSVLDLAYS